MVLEVRLELQSGVFGALGRASTGRCCLCLVKKKKAVTSAEAFSDTAGQLPTQQDYTLFRVKLPPQEVTQ